MRKIILLVIFANSLFGLNLIMSFLDSNMTAAQMWKNKESINLEIKNSSECRGAYEIIQNAKTLEFKATVSDLQNAILDEDSQIVASIIKQKPALISEKISSDDPNFSTIFLTLMWYLDEKYTIDEIENIESNDKNIVNFILCSDEISVFWRDIYPHFLVIDEKSSDKEAEAIFDEMFKFELIDKDVVFFPSPKVSLLEMTFAVNATLNNRKLTFERILAKRPKVYSCGISRFIEIIAFLRENGFKASKDMIVTKELKEFVKSKKWINFIDKELEFVAKLLELGQSYECYESYKAIFEATKDSQSLEKLRNLGKKQSVR